MAKDPAFLFYPGDFMLGTQAFSRSERGAYMDLLIMQFNEGHLSVDLIKRCLGSDFGMWGFLQKKFSMDDKGSFFNERLEFEIEKRKSFTKSRRENFKKKETKNAHMNAHVDAQVNNDVDNDMSDHKGKVNDHMNDHMKPHMDDHMRELMENENENRNINDLKGGAGEKLPDAGFPLRKLFDIWLKHRPKYFYQVEKDMPALRKIAEMISAQENTDYLTAKGCMQVCNTWDHICEFTNKQKLYKDFNLHQIEKYIQTIASMMISEADNPGTNQPGKKPGVMEHNHKVKNEVSELIEKRYNKNSSKK